MRGPLPVPRTGFPEAGVDYLQWAMRAATAAPRVSLLASGAPSGDLRALGEGIAPLLDPAAPFSDRAIREDLSERYRLPSAEILPVLGTSLGLFLACAALLEPGSEVVVEEPAYEALVRVPEALGARVRRFPRRPEAGYRVEADRVAAACTPETRLILASDLHNPTGAEAGDEAVDEIAAGPVPLLLDEVYRDFRPGPPDTARRRGASVMAVGSLTKVYGLGELRAGWVFAPPELVERMESILTVLHVVPPAPMLPWFRRGLRAADRLRDAARARAARGSAILEAWSGTAPDGLRWVPPAGAVFAWVILPPGWTGSGLAERLLVEEGVAVVPGRFFGDDRGIRIGIGGEPALLREGLDAIDRVLRTGPPA